MQTEQKQNNCFETFAWLIHREVESYVNEHEKEFKLWSDSRTAIKEQKKENSLSA